LFEEVVADKGYHSNDALLDFEARGLRPQISEPERGRRHWQGKADAKRAVYANRRRVRSTRSKQLQRARGEKLERSNAHLYETGAMRRTHLRGHANILKRLIVHAAGFNLGLLMRALFGVGKPRTLQDAPRSLRARLHDSVCRWLSRLAQRIARIATWLTCGRDPMMPRGDVRLVA
jgi:transposase